MPCVPRLRSVWRLVGLALVSAGTALSVPSVAHDETQAGPAVQASPDRGAHPQNLTDFDFVVAKVSQNYAGWDSKTAGARRAELDALTASLRAAIAAEDDAQFRAALARWTGWFEDGHLRVQWANASQAREWTVPPVAITEALARAKLALPQARHPVEGLWSIDDRYRLAVLRREGEGEAETFAAVVLSSAVEGWGRGDIKALLTARPDQSFAVRYGAGDRTEIAADARLAAAGDVLDLGDLGIWRRIHDDPARARAAIQRWPGDEFALTRIADDTLYLRLPSFNDGHTQTVRDLIDTHRDDLAATPHLIIDVRGNGGGSDFVYDPVLPLLYTRPIWRLGVEIRVSADNARLRREVADRLASASPQAARTLGEESDRMQAATTAFIRREPPVEIVRLDEVMANPAKIAVLIDRAGSSAENFIMDARQSRKVTLMGQENSSGVIDHGEMMELAAPSGRFNLLWATTRSLRLPGDPVDPDGIAPDVRIPEAASDPVMWAADWLRAARN